MALCAWGREAAFRGRLVFRAALLAAALLFAGPAFAQTRSEPQPLPYVNTTPPPKDAAYPGVVTLHVDATDLERRIMRIKQSIPVAKAGPLTLLYAEWIMGNHAPRGPIYNYAGLKITANGKAVPWVRDPEDVFASIAPVAGTLGADMSCQPSRPISVLETHGTADQIVPFEGGQMMGRGGASTIVSAPDMVTRWRTADGCQGAPADSVLSDAGDGAPPVGRVVCTI